MTGFGSATHVCELGEFTVEVKSLNNRFLDISVKLPRELSFIEPDVREEIKCHVKRGKVDLFLRWFAAAETQPLYEINQPLLRKYADQVRLALDNGSPQSLDLGALLSLPGTVVPTRAASDDSAISQAALESVHKALKVLDLARAQEGQVLIADIENRLDCLDKARVTIAEAQVELVERYRTQLRERVESFQKSIGAAVDPVRIETELMLYADRSDITEELVRIDAHVASFRKQCRSDSGEPVGKFMDFLVQELLREVNTTGNKARGLSIAASIVQMKSEIEKVREQVQNLE